jgi:hypothetical protein
VSKSSSSLSESVNICFEEYVGISRTLMQATCLGVHKIGRYSLESLNIVANALQPHHILLEFMGLVVSLITAATHTMKPDKFVLKLFRNSHLVWKCTGYPSIKSLLSGLYINGNKYQVVRPSWGLNPGLTDRLVVGRKVTLTLTSTIVTGNMKFIRRYKLHR